MTELSATILRLRTQFEGALETEASDWEDWPETLVAASRHGLFGGGKRVRPVLAMMVAEGLGKPAADVLPWAVAVELIHTYSLVHDDLPAMDDDDLRRGLPTCHIKFGEANAILAGDALLTRSFAMLAQTVKPITTAVQLVAILANAAGGRGMVAGQVLDMGGGLDDVETIRQMQALKTGALIQASAEGAAVLAGGGNDVVLAIRAYGEALGALFQITDDILDQEEDGIEDGKNLLNHLTMDAVLALRDDTVHQALSSLNGFDSKATPLREFVHNIAHRAR